MMMLFLAKKKKNPDVLLTSASGDFVLIFALSADAQDFLLQI